jgi:hypothetical protein
MIFTAVLFRAKWFLVGFIMIFARLNKAVFEGFAALIRTLILLQKKALLWPDLKRILLFLFGAKTFNKLMT